MTANIIFSKGGYSVTIQTTFIDDALTNKLFQITPGTGKNNQPTGPKSVKIVDLLRIVRQWQIRGYITPTASKTAKEVKEDLISIFEGGGLAGGTVTMTYDGDTFYGYAEKLAFIEEPIDEPTTLPTDAIKYTVQLTFIEGTAT